ncbi:MAG: hypothetical protein Q8Q63_04565 [Phaeovulum sp.]|jgi:hypothetical protein|nr:hypothetical protein [Phaeovulum sp.]MDP2063143.1 hypothetical protein [Phaeovulum sp.]MDP3860840.1 hypothetical protein [Phaeovulum sp.]
MIRIALLFVLALPLAACGIDGAPKPQGGAATLPAGVGPTFDR